MSQDPLIQKLVVCCFWAPRCNHAEAGLDPAAVHAAMEAHYQDAHKPDIAAILAAWQ